MENPQLPMAMLYLSALSSNPTVFPESSVPLREINLDDPQLRRMSKVLEAIVYFLPVTKGREFALSLEVGERVRIAVAGNDNEHFRPAFGHTPAEAIQFVWHTVHSIATSEETKGTSRVEELVAYLFERHEAKMQARFDKRKEQCRLFFELASDPECRSQRTPEQLKFLEAAQDIFEYTSAVLGLPKEERSESYFSLHYRLEEARTSYAKNDITPYGWRDLELKVQDTLTPSTPFDLIRYIVKLLTPSVHAARLRKTARNHVFQRIIRLPLDVICVPTNPAPSNPLNLPSDQEIRSFLAHCYGEYAPDDEPIVSEVLEKTSTEVLRKIISRSTLDIKPPHCECTLVHYLLSLQNSGPYPCIAVSKLSCLPCGLYLAACRKYGEQKGNAGEEGGYCESLIRFETRGCRADVTPLLALPTGPTTADMDAFVEEDILNAVKEIVKVVLRNSVNKERMRRLSRSTAGSDGSSPEGGNSTLALDFKSAKAVRLPKIVRIRS